MKSAFECKHVEHVTAIALLWEGKKAGKIVCNWSDNPSGTVCTASLSIRRGPLADITNAHGRAGGYGYDKRSAAIADALRRARFWDIIPTEEAPFSKQVEKSTKNGKRAIDIAPVNGGSGNERAVFERLGYDWFEII